MILKNKNLRTSQDGHSRKRELVQRQDTVRGNGERLAGGKGMKSMNL